MMLRRLSVSVVVVACVLGLLTAPGAQAAAAPAVRIIALSYNIHHGEGLDGQLDLGRIAEVIRASGADIVALQEVDRGVQRSGEVDQAGELGRLLDMHQAFGGNIRHQGGDYGNAVLSRWPIARHENHLLPSTGGEQRGVLQVEIHVPQVEDPLCLLATHLDHRRGDEERVRSARFINELTMVGAQRAAILMGDLNDVRGSRTLNQLESRWTQTTGQATPTIPTARPTRQIDFVLVRPANRWRVLEVRVIDERIASDHLPILAVLELRSEE